MRLGYFVQSQNAGQQAYAHEEDDATCDIVDDASFERAEEQAPKAEHCQSGSGQDN